MSGIASSSGVACRQCARPFGAAVAFCPFCGAAQQAAQPAPGAGPAMPPRPVPAKVSSVPNAHPPPANDRPAASRFAAQDVVAPGARQRSDEPSDEPAVKKPFWPRKRRWRVSTAVWLLGLIAAAYALRPQLVGTLIVFSSPGVPGVVLIDGNRAGSAGEPVDVSAGTHRVGYEAHGWIASPQQITVVARRRRRLTIALLAAPATIVLDLQTPGTALRLDGAPVAASDTGLPGFGLRVAAGRHRLTATRPGFAAVTLDLVLARGERRDVAIILSPLAAREMTRVAQLQNWSEPVIVPPHTSCTITATSPFRLRVGREVFLIQPGTQTNPGEAQSRSLQVRGIAGQPVEIHFALTPEE